MAYGSPGVLQHTAAIRPRRLPSLTCRARLILLHEKDVPASAAPVGRADAFPSGGRTQNDLPGVRRMPGMPAPDGVLCRNCARRSGRHVCNIYVGPQHGGGRGCRARQRLADRVRRRTAALRTGRASGRRPPGQLTCRVRCGCRPVPIRLPPRARCAAAWASVPPPGRQVKGMRGVRGNHGAGTAPGGGNAACCSWITAYRRQVPG